MRAVQKHLREGLIVCGRYEVERLWGTQDTGFVYLCHDLQAGKARVRLKILNEIEASGSTDSLSLEFSLLCRLRHPNLVRVLDFGTLEDSGEHFLVEEWADGKDLHTGTEGMSADRVIEVLVELSETLRYLHSRGIVHGGLNPPNALLSRSGETGQLRLLNFGLKHRLPVLAPAGGFGTLAYMAPEILMGGVESESSDLYSFGILMYQLLSRRLPFEDADPGFLVQRHLQMSVDWRPIEHLKGGPGLRELLCLLLDKDPSKRPTLDRVATGLLENAGRSSEQSTGAKCLENCFSASRFVGRKTEMQQLQSIAAQVRMNRRGWTVFITGEAGSGKTRIMEEFKSWALLEGWRVIEGACRTQQEGAYGPYRQIMANTVPASGVPIFTFDDLPRVADSGSFDSSQDFAAGQFRDLLTRELVRRLSEKPTLLLLHDFHLADEATSTVLDYLSSDIQAHPVCMCVSLRSGEEPKEALNRVLDLVLRQQRGELLNLNPLQEEDVAHLVAGMTGDDRLKECLGPWMFKSIGGNPFFVEEMLKHLVEQGILRPEVSGWRFLDQDLPKLDVPASVGVVLRRRFDQLSPPARELADWLALFHRPVPAGLLGSVTGRNVEELSAPLQELNRKQMVRALMQRGEQTLEYCHPLIAEVIRGDLNRNDRRRMHCRIAGILQRDDCSGGSLQEIAMHHMEGQSGPTAVQYALSLASQFRIEFAHEKALHCFEYVFKHRGELSPDELCAAAIEASDTMFALGIPKRAIQVLKSEMNRNPSIGVECKAQMYMQLALSYQNLGDLRLQEQCCRNGLQLFSKESKGIPNSTKAMLLAELAFGSVLRAEPRRGLVDLKKALKACPDPNRGALAARIQYLDAYLHRTACNLPRALVACKKATRILALCEETYLSCSGNSTLGSILMGLGRFVLALEKHKLAVSLSEKNRSVILKAQALGNMAECLCRMGYMPEAVDAAERAIRCVSESNNPAISYAFNTILAEVRLAAGEYTKSIDILRRLEGDYSANPALYAAGHAHYVAASAHFLLGNYDHAIEYIRSLGRMQTCAAPFYEAELAEALDARILFEKGKFQQSIRMLDRLDKKVSQKHWPYQMCIIKLHLAEVLIRQGMLHIAEKHVRNATKLARGMQSVTLVGHSRLLSGILCSIAAEGGGEKAKHDRAIKELQAASTSANSSFSGEITWRAHAELAFLFKKASNPELCVYHAEKALEQLHQLMTKVPSDLLGVYRDAFDRNYIESELKSIVEAHAESRRRANIAVAELPDYDKSRILLRVSAAVNSTMDLSSLLGEILDQLLAAVGVERAFVLLRDESNAELRLAMGRNSKQETLLGTEIARANFLNQVCEKGNPIVSADVRSDPRALQWKSSLPQGAARLLCAPLRASGRILGVLYADHSSPTESLSESVLNFFAAFCNLAAIAIDNALSHQQLVKEKSELEEYLHQARDGYPEIVGKSSAVEALRDRIGLAAGSPLDILITGESGTGKELVARALHRTGRRKAGKFIAVDCGSLSETLIDAELFGTRKGAFTGSIENRIGLLEAANRGTIFFDEISNMPFRMQAKLLRVLQEREVRRIGETTPFNIDLQVIAASNRDLLEEVRLGRFRKDLYYRLKMMEIPVPPLRDRSEDIPLLLEWFLQKIAETEGGRSKQFSQEAKQLLRAYSYPGNIRELRNIVYESYYLARGPVITVTELPSEVRQGTPGFDSTESGTAGRLYIQITEGRADFETVLKEPFQKREFSAPVLREVIARALKDSGGRYREAFIRLHIPPSRYHATIAFLKRNKCYLDYKPYRKARRDSEEVEDEET